MRSLYKDIRYGVHMLAAHPGFTAVAILSLALGIGANTSMFSLADAMLLRPLPVEHPSEIVRVVSTSQTARYESISYPDYFDFRDRTKSLSGLVGSKNMSRMSRRLAAYARNSVGQGCPCVWSNPGSTQPPRASITLS